MNEYSLAHCHTFSSNAASVARHNATTKANTRSTSNSNSSSSHQSCPAQVTTATATATAAGEVDNDESEATAASDVLVTPATSTTRASILFSTEAQMD